MAIETVQFFLFDQLGSVLPGVLVRVFDATGTQFITQQVSDSAGVAEVGINGEVIPVTYTIRLSKLGVAFDGSLGTQSRSPQSISVYSPPVPATPNAFDLIGETFIRPVAADPMLCRCSGFFRDAAGRPLVGYRIQITSEFKPAIIQDALVAGDGVALVTDSRGYVEVDLYRGGKYVSALPGLNTPDSSLPTGAIVLPRFIIVPNQGSANLVDLLFPVVSSVVFSQTQVTLRYLEPAELTAVVRASDGRVLQGCAVEDVVYTSSNPSVVSVGATMSGIQMIGLDAGTATITATRKDTSIVRVPDVPVFVSALEIVVLHE